MHRAGLHDIQIPTEDVPVFYFDSSSEVIIL